MKNKKDNEQSLLNILPLNNYTGSFNWLIPVSIIYLIVGTIIITTNIFETYNVVHDNIIEKLIPVS